MTRVVPAARSFDCPEHPAGPKRHGRRTGGCWRTRCVICSTLIHRKINGAGRPPVTCSTTCRKRKMRGENLLPIA